MRPLLVPDLAQQSVGVRIPGRAPVEVAHLVILGGLAGGEQPIHRGDPGLEPQPERHLHRPRVGNGNVELGHPLLEAPPVASLGLRHLAQNRRVAVTHAARDQFVDRAGEDLTTPRLLQTRSCLRERRRIVGLSFAGHRVARLPRRGTPELKVR